MSKVKAFQRGIDDAIAALDDVCAEYWREFGLPELLAHLETVAADLGSNNVKRAFEQHGALDEKLLRFSKAISNYRFQGRATDIWKKFRSAAHDYADGDLRAIANVYLRDIKNAILELEEIRSKAWESQGLPELLEHLESVAADLHEAKVKRALGQIPFLNQKFEQFRWAVGGVPIGRRVAMIAATYGGVVIDHVPDEMPWSEHVRPPREWRAERLTRRLSKA